MASAAANGDGQITGAALDPPEVRKEARLAMMELANMVAVPMALNAVVRLNVPDAIWQSGSNAPLSAAEITPLLRPPAPPTAYADPSVLERLLRLLASHGVFDEHRSRETGIRRYSLTHVGRTLVPISAGEESVSYAEYVLQHHQDALIRAWPRLHESVLDPAGPEPFARANGGVPAYAYYGVDREANALMQRAMWGVSVPFMESFLDGYTGDVDTGGFAGVETLVDVGGSSGACLEMIMKRAKFIFSFYPVSLLFLLTLTHSLFMIPSEKAVVAAGAASCLRMGGQRPSPLLQEVAAMMEATATSAA